MVDGPQVVLRQRSCRGHDCGASFLICRSCDRGQQYCSDRCRSHARLQQHRRANARHQRSPEGRLDHRDRQRDYRLRHARRRVTDQGSPPPCRQRSIPSPDMASAGNRCPRAAWEPLRCALCGRLSRFIDPFVVRR